MTFYPENSHYHIQIVKSKYITLMCTNFLHRSFTIWYDSKKMFAVLIFNMFNLLYLMLKHTYFVSTIFVSIFARCVCWPRTMALHHEARPPSWLSISGVTSRPPNGPTSMASIPPLSGKPMPSVCPSPLLLPVMEMPRWGYIQLW